MAPPVIKAAAANTQTLNLANMVVTYFEIRSILPIVDAGGVRRVASATRSALYGRRLPLAKLDQDLIAGPVWTALLKGHHLIVRAETFLRMVAPEDAAAAALLQRNAVLIEHFLAPQHGARAFGQSQPGIVGHGEA